MYFSRCTQIAAPKSKLTFKIRSIQISPVKILVLQPRSNNYIEVKGFTKIMKRGSFTAVRLSFWFVAVHYQPHWNSRLSIFEREKKVTKENAKWNGKNRFQQKKNLHFWSLHLYFWDNLASLFPYLPALLWHKQSFLIAQE